MWILFPEQWELKTYFLVSKQYMKINVAPKKSSDCENGVLFLNYIIQLQQAFLNNKTLRPHLYHAPSPFSQHGFYWSAGRNITLIFSMGQGLTPTSTPCRLKRCLPAGTLNLRSFWGSESSYVPCISSPTAPCPLRLCFSGPSRAPAALAFHLLCCACWCLRTALPLGHISKSMYPKSEPLLWSRVLIRRRSPVLLLIWIPLLGLLLKHELKCRKKPKGYLNRYYTTTRHKEK